jgi:hypothetical protein
MAACPGVVAAECRAAGVWKAAAPQVVALAVAEGAANRAAAAVAVAAGTDVSGKNILDSSSDTWDDLWLLMHPSGDPNLKAVAVTCYLDESGTHDQSQVAVVAGIALNLANLRSLEAEWFSIREKYGISGSIHMKEFNKDRRLGKLPARTIRALFTEIVDVINEHKIYSVAGRVDNKNYEKMMPKHLRVRNYGMSAYGLGFLMCAFANHLQAEHNGYAGDIAYLMDSGNAYAGHVVKLRDAFAKGNLIGHVGNLTFGSDEDYAALQVADIVAWVIRRRGAKGHFPEHYLPLTALLTNHVQLDFDEQAIQGLHQAVLRRIEEADNLEVDDSEI